MIKLIDILLESKASEEAKKLGLKHTSFGRYADKSGKIVAMSRNGRLVHISGDEISKKTDPAKKKKVSRNQKVMADILDAVDLFSWSSSVTWAETGRHHSDADVQERVDVKKKIAHKFLTKEIIKGEKTKYLNPHASRIEAGHDLTDFPQITASWDLDSAVESDQAYGQGEDYLELIGKSDDLKLQADNIDDIIEEKSTDQHDNWAPYSTFGNDNVEDIRALIEDLNLWVSHGNWKSKNSDERMWTNRRINELTWNRGQPIMLEKGISLLERGMAVPIEEAEEFLKSFVVGSEVTLPPSGWSAKSKLARGYGSDYPITNKVNIQFRMKNPKHGLHLTGIKSALVPLIDHHYEEMKLMINEGIQQGYFDHEEGPESFMIDDEAYTNLYEPVNGLGYDFDVILNQMEEAINDSIPSDRWKDMPDDEGDKFLQKAYDHTEKLKFLINQLQECYMNIQWSPFDWEAEIIRPGWASNEVTKVTKNISWMGGSERQGETGEWTPEPPQITYVIDLEETGAVRGEKNWVSETKRKKIKKVKATPTTKKYTNTPFRQGKRKKKKRK